MRQSVDVAMGGAQRSAEVECRNRLVAAGAVGLDHGDVDVDCERCVGGFVNGGGHGSGVVCIFQAFRRVVPVSWVRR